MFFNFAIKMNYKTFLTFIFFIFSFILFSCNRSTDPLDNIGPDTTSHNWVWTVDTIGIRNTVLSSVSVINENNIWVGGYINTDEYTALHWNNKEWEYIQIIEDQYNIPFIDLEDIWAISNDNIWIGNGSIYNYDGTIANLSYLRNIGTGERVTSLWYNTPDDIYGVGHAGIVVHYDGKNWQEIESPTVGDFTDIWGVNQSKLNKETIMATVSTPFEKKEQRLLSISGGNVKDTLNWDSNIQAMSVWFDNTSPVYVCGNDLRYFQDSIWTVVDLPNYFLERVRGSSEDNIFVIGSFGFMARYDGLEWHIESQFLMDHGSLLDIVVMKNLVIAVGTDGTRGIIIKGNR